MIFMTKQAPGRQNLKRNDFHDKAGTRAAKLESDRESRFGAFILYNMQKDVICC